MAAKVQPETILKEMNRLWASLGKKGGGEGVLRACAMTLIAVMPESGDGAAVSETVGEIMREHPSRAILVRLSDESKEPEAQVTAQCWMPFGQRQQICCEQVEITASLEGLPSLRPFLLALIAPDLPVAVWLRGQLDFEALRDIAPAGGKLIVDSAAWPDTRAVLGKLARASVSGRIGDLSWARLTRWREIVAQMFENCACQSRLNRIERIEIEHGGDRVPPAAFYLAAWLARGLGWAPERARKVRFRAVPESPAGSIHGFTMSAGEFDVLARRTEETAIELTVGELRWVGVLPRPTEAALLDEELSIAGRDRVFEETLPAAAALAG